MYSSFGKLILRYLIFVGIPFLIAKRIEKWLIAKLDPEVKKELNEKLKRFPDIEDISEETRNGLDNRGGADPLLLWVTKVVVVDFALKVAVATAFGATIWSDTADQAAAQLAKYGGAILTAPGNKFKKLYQTLKKVDPQHTQDIREILIDKDLSLMEKIELLKIKIEQTLKQLRGGKRKQFILFVIATIIFSVGGNVGIFGVVMERLRALLGTGANDDSLRQALIEIYQEYNAPLPKELLPEEIIESIKSLD